MLPIREFYSINESEKDNLYFDRMIRFIRMNWWPLVNHELAQLGMDYLFGHQNMSSTEDLFQDPSQINLTNRPTRGGVGVGGLVNQYNEPIVSPENDTHIHGMKGIGFRSMPVLIKAFRIMIAEMKKMGPVVTVRANDPTSTEKRKQDEIFIKNKKQIETLLSYMYMNIGQAPVKLSDYQQRFGEKHDAGNTQDFEKMGLDNADPDDVANFMEVFYKLDWEASMSSIIDALNETNEVQQNKIQMWATDVIAKNAAAAQVYVSDENGQLVYEYLSPETTYIYGATGRRQDFNDCMAKGKENSVTIKQFLDQVGDEFDWEENMGNLMLAVLYGSNGAVDITGINPSYRGIGVGDDWFCAGNGNTRYSWDDFMNFKVTLGYIEWSSQNYTDYGKSVKSKGKKFDNKKTGEQIDKEGGTGDGWGASDPNNVAPDGKKYQTKARYECPTYKSYYLALTSYNHVKFNAGKSTYQNIDGYNDINANFSIITWKETGDAIAILAMDMVDTINEFWYKWRMIVRKSKAPGMDYNWESLEAIGKLIFCDTEGRENRNMKTLEFLNASSNTVWSFPEVDGKVTGMNVSQLNIPRENGLPANFMLYWEGMTSTWDKLIDMLIGSSELRQGNSPASRSSMNNEFKSLENSQASTSFIPDIITFMCRQLSVRSGMIIQDIVKFKGYEGINSLAYKYLQDLVGDEALDKVAAMGTKAMHRYGIFVESLNQAPARAKLSNRIDFALQKGTKQGGISLAEAVLVEDEKSPMQAFKVLAFFEQRNTKLEQKAAQAQAQQQQQAAQQAQQVEGAVKKMEVDGKITVANIQAKAMQQGHLISQEGGLAKQKMKQDGDNDNVYHQVNADLLKEQALLNNAGQTTPPPLPPPIQAQQQRQGPPIPQQQSVVQQELNQAQPGANLQAA